MSDAEAWLAVARAIRAELHNLLPRRGAREADAELGALLARAEAGEDVTAALIEVLNRREATRSAARDLFRGDRAAGYQPPIGGGGRFQRGTLYACPVPDCEETGDRFDDSEPEPRCGDHRVTMHRL